jgi:predicted SAM-dependent methyltransferase
MHQTTKKLEIGGGNKPKEGYLQMDMKKLPGIDIIGDAKDIPLKDSSLDEIYGHWVLEHFSYRDIVPLLKHWHSKLKPEGRVYMVTNNGEAHLNAYLMGVIDIHELNRMMFGTAQKWLPEEKATKLTPRHHYEEPDIEDLHKIFWTKVLVRHFFEPIFDNVEVKCTWKHREDDGTFKCPGIIIKAYK